MSFESPLRDLMRKLHAVAEQHIAFPQATAALGHLNTHLSALAYAEEISRQVGDHGTRLDRLEAVIARQFPLADDT